MTSMNSMMSGKIWQYTKCGYYSVVALGVASGVYNGFYDWCKWLAVREAIKLGTFSNLETVVNGSHIAGKLAFNLLLTGLTSGFVAGTCLVSVPLLTYFDKTTITN